MLRLHWTVSRKNKFSLSSPYTLDMQYWTLNKFSFVDLLLRAVVMVFSYPANIYLFKVNNRNTRKSWGIWKQQNDVSDVVLFFLLTLNKFRSFFQCFYWWLWRVNVSWRISKSNMFSKCKKLLINCRNRKRQHLLKKFLMENFTFYVQWTVLNHLCFMKRVPYFYLAFVLLKLV